MIQEMGPGILGISLIDEQLRIVEGRKEANEFQIAGVAHGRLRQPFSFEAFSDNNMSRRFAEDINRLYASQNFQEKGVAFSLETSMVLIKKVPLDRALPESRISEQIKWEVSQFAISALNEYIIDYEEILSGSANGSIRDMLVVAVRKRIIGYLRQVFSHTELQLRIVDVDLFAAQRALALNYDTNEDARIGLIDVEERRAHLTILFGQQYYLSHDILFPANAESGSKEQAAARIITKELKRIILEEKIGNGIEALKEIFLYGESVEDKLLEELQNDHDVRIHRANPFNRIKVQPQVKNEINETRPERFMISVGAALRGFR